MPNMAKETSVIKRQFFKASLIQSGCDGLYVLVILARNMFFHSGGEPPQNHWRSSPQNLPK